MAYRILLFYITAYPIQSIAQICERSRPRLLVGMGTVYYRKNVRCYNPPCLLQYKLSRAKISIITLLTREGRVFNKQKYLEDRQCK